MKQQRIQHNFIKIRLWRGRAFKPLTFGLKQKGGRNVFGRICSFRKGGGFKVKYRIIDFRRNLLNIKAIVRRIEYDPNRSAYIALVCYQNGFISYIIAVENLEIGFHIVNHSLLNQKDLKVSYLNNVGSSFLLKNIAGGLLVNNIELITGGGSCFCRAAGTFGIVLNAYIIKNKNYIQIKLPSGTLYFLNIHNRACIGVVSNSLWGFKFWKKAGRSRNKGIRPTVRGVAMNPIDHPHGGGEGRKSPKVCAMSPWGKLSKGIKTRKYFKSNKYIIKK